MLNEFPVTEEEFCSEVERDVTPNVLPVTYSLLSPAALMATLASRYPIDQPAVCRGLYLGVNDTYLVQTATARYILRVYRAHHRSLAEVQFELDLLQHLAAHGLSVALPVARHDGSYIHVLRAPEGIRPAVLFAYAAGQAPPADVQHAPLLGRVMAQFHTAADVFTSPHTRFQVDLAYLLDRPLQTLRPVLAHRPDDWTYLVTLAEQLRTHMHTLPATVLDWGVCHNDFQPQNMHIAADHTITVFDFDYSGRGWRAFDLAQFYPRSLDEVARWDAFLTGYRGERPISDIDLVAVPLFVAMLRIWSMGFFAAHRSNSQWGADAMNGEYFDSEFTFLQEWTAGLE